MRGAAVAVCLAAAGGAVADVQGASSGNYVIHRWQVRDGLPHPVVYKMAQDGRGYMWLATFGGMVRFDGRDFVDAGLLESRAGVDEPVRNLAIEDERTLIVLPQEGGVYRYRDGRFSMHPVSSEVKDLSLLDLFVGVDGTLWLGSADGTLVWWSDGRARRVDLSDRLTDPGIRFSFAADRHGRTWVSRGRYLGRHQDNELVAFADAVGESIFITSGNDGQLWVASTEGLFRCDGTRMKKVALDREWPVAKSGLSQLFEDSQGTLWIGTRRQGLLRVTNGRLTLADDYFEYVSSILEDTEGNIWTSFAGGGIARLRMRDLLVLDSSVGLPRDVSLSVCVDERGAVWCANRSGGLVRYVEGRVERFTTAAGEVPFATAVCPDERGKIWVGTADGAFLIDSKDPEFLVRQPGAYGVVSLLYCAENGDMWVNANRGGLRVFRDEQLLHAYGPDEGVPSTRLSGIAQDREGRIWITTMGGQLLRLSDDDERFESRQTELGDFSGEIYAIRRDSRGDFWLGTSQGLMFHRDGNSRLLGLAEGLPDSIISQVIEDNGGRLWVASRQGLWSASLDELHAVMGGALPMATGISVSSHEGLPAAASLPTMQPRAWLGPRGRLWFATYTGVVGVNVGTSAPSHPAPPVYIDEVYLDGTVVGNLTDFRVPPGRHTVEFRFSAPTFTAPHLVRLRHRLVGFDDDWLRTPDDRLAQYARLPPGEYELRVSTRQADGQWGDEEATMPFRVLPAWWQNMWVIGGGVVVLLLIVVSSVRAWSQRRLKLRIQRMEQAHALDRERNRIARDLHDDVGTSLTRLGFMTERLKRQAATPEGRESVERIVAQTRRVVVDLESIVWTVNPKNQTWDRFALYLNHYAQEFFRETGVRCTVDGDDAVPKAPLPPEVQRHLLATYKEILNNVMKHAQASRVTIGLVWEDGLFRFHVEDNGCGFERDPEQDSLRNGLRNMRSRLDEVGGRLVIDSRPGAGTRIVCTVPVQFSRMSPAT